MRVSGRFFSLPTIGTAKEEKVNDDLPEKKTLKKWTVGCGGHLALNISGGICFLSRPPSSIFTFTFKWEWKREKQIKIIDFLFHRNVSVRIMKFCVFADNAEGRFQKNLHIHPFTYYVQQLYYNHL